MDTKGLLVYEINLKHFLLSLHFESVNTEMSSTRHHRLLHQKSPFLFISFQTSGNLEFSVNMK